MNVFGKQDEKANLNEIVNNIDNLNQSEKQKLKALLFKYEHLFDGTLGQFVDDPVDFELKGAKPYAAKPYGLPASIEVKLRRELERFCDIGVMRRSSPSEWASPTFATAKKNHQIWVVSDFRRLNKQLRRKPFPLPKIQDILQQLGRFTYATSLDLNMGYYTI